MAGQASRAGWALLTGELSRHRRALAILAAWSVVECLPALLSGALVAAALDQGFMARQPLVGLGWLGLLGLTMVIKAAATRNTFPWLAQIVEPIRDALVTTVVRGALERSVYAGDRPDGAAVARLSGQAETVRNLVAALLRTLRPTLVSLVLALVGLVALAPIVAAITAPLVLLSLGTFFWTMRILVARQRAMILAQETMTRISTEVFDGLRDVVACGAVDSARDTVGQAVTREAQAIRAVARASLSRTAIMAMGGQVPLVLLLLQAPWLLRSGRLTTGELVGAVTYLVGTLDPALRALAGTVGTWGRQLGVLLHRIAETSVGSVAMGHLGQAEPESFDLLASGLTFSYGPHADPVIHDLTLHIRAGEHLAIVGPSGIGKSTLASLLTSLVSPQAGEVLLGGVPTAEVAAAHLRHTVALIPQEAYVFTGSLRENIDYLCPGVTIARLDQAVDVLGLRPLVDRLGGYGAQLGVGGPMLSAGERQLIALARIYVSEAKVVVLDEATCYLDPASEARAEEALAATGRTLVVIAHRISSARRAERILLLDGTSAVTGSHDELLAISTRYADLVGHWKGRPSAEDDADIRPEAYSAI